MSYGQKVFKYIEKGNTKKVEQYLKKHDVIYDTLIIKNKNAFSKIDEEKFVLPLSYAVIKNKPDIVKLFVKDSLKIPNFREQLGVAFALSMSVKNDTISNFLYNLNPDLSAMCTSCHQHSAIMIATAYGNEKWYFKLKPYSVLTTINHHGHNLIHLSVVDSNYYQPIFDDLLKTPQLNINLTDSFGYRPIDYAITYNFNQAFYQLEKESQARNVSSKTSNYFAALGGNLEVFNYLDKDSNSYNYSVWEPIYREYKQSIDFDNAFAYLIEVAVDGNNVNLVKIIYNKMLNDIVNENDPEEKEYKAGILTSILNNRYIDSDCTYRNFVIYTAIKNKNKELFEFLISKSVEFNAYNFKCFHKNNIEREIIKEPVKVYFSKWEYKQAKKVFGKEYVKSLYQKLEIKF